MALRDRGPRWAVLTATALGLGLSPVMPGTVGSLAGLALALPASLLPPDLAVLVPLLGLVVSVALAALSIPPVLAATRQRDPSFIVIDEVAGMALALCLVPPEWPWALAAFILFRALDILKPYPIGRLERLPGWWGVMADDLAAGAVAGLIAASIRWGFA